MPIEKWQVEKNIKDLEYHSILNKITAAVVILATIVVTGIFSAWPARGKIAILFTIGFMGAVLILHWYNQLQAKAKEINALK